MQAFRKRDEGFTLVELMVVVLIIGILVAVAIPVFNAARGRAETNACFDNQRTIEGAAQTLVADGETITAGPVSASGLVSDYIKNNPICPTTDVGYTIDANGTVADCASHGHYTD